MDQRRLAQVDLSTGELMEGGQLALVFPKRRNGFVGGWVAMSQEAMLQIANSGLGAESLRVFIYLVGNLDFENWININQTDAAAAVGMKRPNFARGLRQLREFGVVLAGPKVGRNATFRLNPNYGWKGSAKGHTDALRERMKARGLSVVEGGVPAERDTSTMDLFDADSPAQ